VSLCFILLDGGEEKRSQNQVLQTAGSLCNPFLLKVFLGPPETQGKDAGENKRKRCCGKQKVNDEVSSVCLCLLVVMVSCLSEKLNSYLCYSLVSFVCTDHSLFRSYGIKVLVVFLFGFSFS